MRIRSLCVMTLCLTASVLPAPVPAGGTLYLPLSRGERWELRSPVVRADIAFEVERREADGYRVRWENPWRPAVFVLRVDGDRVLVRSLDTGGGMIGVAHDTVFFDFGLPVGHSWTNALGTMTVVSRTKRVTTPLGEFSRCIEIRAVDRDGRALYFSFAPGVGFVQFGRDEWAFRLSGRRPSARRIRVDTRPSRRGAGISGTGGRALVTFLTSA